MTFRQCLTYSIFGHVALLALLFAWGPSRPRYALPPMAIPVRMVTLPQTKATSKAAKPVPVPAPKPAPEPPKPVPKAPTNKVVIPEKPKPAPKPVPKAKPPQPAPQPQVDYEDFLAELRKEKGDEVPAPEEDQVAVAGPVNQAPAEGMADGSPDGLPLDPAALAWLRAVRLHLKRVWVVPPDFRNSSLEAAASANLDLAGNVLGGSVRIVHSSGNPYYDQSVERALTKASPLPPPPQAGEWTFVFRPEDF